MYRPVQGQDYQGDDGGQGTHGDYGEGPLHGEHGGFFVVVVVVS